MIETTNADRERELTALARPRGHLVDGLLYSLLGLGPEDVEQLHTSTPMVLLGERIFHGPVDHVMIDNVEGTKAVVRHLLDQGRRRIAVIGIRPGEQVGTAASGTAPTPRRSASTAYPCRSSWPCRAEVAPVERSDAMEELLATGQKFDAVFALNDTLALGVVRALTAHGIRIADDVAVAGFDNIDEASYSSPTSRRSTRTAARSPGPRSSCWCGGWPVTTPRHQEIVAPYQPHVRESTAADRSPKATGPEGLTVPEHPGIISTPM